MRKLMTGIAAALLCTGCAKNTPEQAAEAFYKSLLQDQQGGGFISQPADAIRPLMSSELLAAIEKDLAYLEVETRLDPEEGPSDVPGYAVNSHPNDGFNAFTVSGVSREGGAAQVTVEFTWQGVGRDGQPETVRWRDVVRVVKEERTWKLDDFLYSAESPGSLKAALSASSRCISPVVLGRVANWIEGQISTQREQNKNADIAARGIKPACGDLLEGPAGDLAVLYTLAGPTVNDHGAQHLAVFELKGGDMPSHVASAQVGGKGAGQFEDVKIAAPGQIELHGKRHKQGDESCCPSEPFSEQWVVQGDRLAPFKPDGL